MSGAPDDSIVGFTSLTSGAPDDSLITVSGGGGGGTAAYPTSAILIPPFGIGANRWTQNWYFIEDTPGVVCPYNMTLNNYRDTMYQPGAKAPALGDFMVVAVMLGPKGSRWAMNVGWLASPNFGNIRCEFGSVPVNADGTITDITAVSFINFNADLGGFLPALAIRGAAGINNLRLMGNDGTVATTWNAGTFETDGGAGIYAFRFTVLDNTPVTGGHQAAFTELSFERYDEGFLAVG